MVLLTSDEDCQRRPKTGPLTPRQEYARQLYARVGMQLHRNLRFDVPWSGDFAPSAWPREMTCIDWALSSLETDGWLVNQTRLWLASTAARLDWARRAPSIATAQFKTFLRTRCRARFPNQVRDSFEPTISQPPEAQPRSSNAQRHNRYRSRSNPLVTPIRHSSRIPSSPPFLSLTNRR